MIVLLGALLLGLLHVTFTWQDGDEGRIMILAESFAAGRGPLMMHSPEPYVNLIVPPAYPWVLSLIHRAFAGALWPMRLLSLFCYVGTVLLFWYMINWTQGTWSRGDKLAALAVGFGGVFMLSFTWRIFSEMPYMLVTYGSFCLLGMPGEKGRSTRIIFSALLAGLSVMVRPVGLVLPVAGTAALLLRKQWRWAAAYALVSVAVNIPLIAFTWQHYGVPFAYMSRYADAASGAGGSLADKISTILYSGPRYFFLRLPNRLFFSLFDYHCLLCRVGLGAAVIPLKIGVGVLIVAGFLSRCRHMHVMEWFFLGYWPLISSFNQADFAQRGVFLFQDRYLLPVIPLAAFYLVEGYRLFVRRLRLINWPAGLRAARYMPLLMAGYVIMTAVVAGGLRLKTEMKLWGLHGWASERYYHTGHPFDSAWARYVEAGEWIRKNSEKDAVIVCRKSDHMFLFSGRKSHRYDGTEVQGSSIWAIITAYAKDHPVYIVQDAFPKDSGYGMSRMEMLDPAISNQQDRLELVHISEPPITRIWKITKTESSNATP